MKTIVTSIAVMLLAAFLNIGGCATTGGTGGVISSVQAWYHDPANAALIAQIEATAIRIASGFLMAGGPKSASVEAKTTSALADQYPNVPAGVLKDAAHKAVQSKMSH